MPVFAAKLNSLKYDSVKEKHSITLTPHMVLDGENIGSGTNMNINNLSPEDYNLLCEHLKVKKIEKGMPFMIDIHLAAGGEEKGLWQEAHGEDEDENEDAGDQE